MSDDQQRAERRFDVFLSHSRRDAATVLRIARRLRQEGVEPWLDTWCLTPGGSWQHEVASGLDASSACAVFVGSDDLGAWERQEVDLALDRAAKEHGFRVFPVLLPGLAEPFDPNSLPHFLRTRTWVDYRAGSEAERPLHDLLRAVHGLPFGTDAPARRTAEGACPYLGLGAFQEWDAGVFFGRGAEVQRLIEKLRAERFLALVGPSGSGKSSLARAGLVPALRGGALPGSADCVYATLTPGAAPLTALTAAVVGVGGGRNAMHETLDRLSADRRSLHLAVALALTDRPANDRVFLVVDQFEEIFTLCGDERQRAEFCANLVYAATAPGGRTVVILTLRADFYARCVVDPELAQLLAANQFLVGPIAADGLRAAIEEPAHLFGLELEAGLAPTILADAGSEPGSLPLLEYALLELWRQRRGQLLTLAAYRDSGGVAGSLATRAEDVFRSLKATEQATARRLLLRLTQPGEGVEDARRRATVAEFAGAPGGAAADRVVRTLTDARLLTTGVDAGSGDKTVEVSHEALIRGWPRLRGWIDEDRSGLRIHRRLTDAANDWQRLERDASALYRGARLATAREWAAGHDHDLSELEGRFLAQSSAAEQGELELARRRERLLRALALALLVGIAAALALALVARNASDRAQRETRRAQEQSARVLSTSLSDQAIATLGSRPDVALLLAIQAGQAADTSEARQALVISAETMQLNGRAQVLSVGRPVRSVAFSLDGRMLATADAGGAVRLWDVTSRRPVGVPLRGDTSQVVSVAFSPDGRTLAGGGADGTRLWDIASRRPLGSPFGDPVDPAAGGPVHSVAFSPDGRTLATAGENGTVGLWDVASRRLLGVPLNGLGDAFSVAFSPDGRTLAGAGFGEGRDLWTVQLWDVASRRLLGAPLHRRTGQVFSVAFSPDGRTLASAGSSGAVQMWDVASRRPLGLPMHGTSGAVTDVAFSPDGGTLASAGEDGTVRLWDVASRRLVGAPLRGHAAQVLSVAFKPDGHTLASGSQDGTVRLWNVASRRPLGLAMPGHTEEVFSVAFSPDGRTLASTGFSGAVQLWDVASRRPLGLPLLRGGASNGVAFSPDGRTLAIADGDGTTRVWEVANRRPLGLPLRGTGPVASVAFSPDGRTLASASDSEDPNAKAGGTVQLWDAASRRPLGAPLRGIGQVFSVAFSPDGRVLAADDGTVRLWAVASRRPLGVLLRGSEAFAFSPDGRTLASGGDDGKVRLWEVAARRPLAVPLRGTGRVSSVAFSPDGRMLASAGGDGEVRLWAVATRHPLGLPLRGTAPAFSVAFSPDGRMLASGDSQRARVWTLPLVAVTQGFATIRQSLCPLAARNFSRAEWSEFLPSIPYRKTCPRLPAGT